MPTPPPVPATTAEPDEADGQAPLPAWVGPDGAAEAEPPPAEPTRRIPVRAIRATVTIAVVLVVALLLVRQGRAIDWSETADELRDASPWWFLVALGVFHGGFLQRCWRWQVLLDGATDGGQNVGGERRPPFHSLVGIMYRAWFVNSVTPARAGDAYRGYLLKRRTGASFTSTLGTIVSERVVDVIVLAMALIASILLAFHSDLPRGVPELLALAGVLAVGGPVGLLFLRRLEPALLRRLPARLAGRVGTVTASMLASVRRMPLLLVLSAGGWLGETLTLLFVARALGIDLPITHAATVALLTALLTTLPITPGGLGVADAGMIFLLGLVDIPTGPAAAIAILARVITFGSVVLIGGAWTLRGLLRDHVPARSILNPAAD
jgi:glycosyltransferase 2 family protein